MSVPTDEALAGQILSRTHIGPGSSDLRARRQLMFFSGFQTRLSAIHEDIWDRTSDPQLEEKNFVDLVVLSPLISGCSPLSASFVDRGLLFKILRPILDFISSLISRASAIWITISLILSEVSSSMRSDKERSRGFALFTANQHSRHSPSEAENEHTGNGSERRQDGHIMGARTSFESCQNHHSGAVAPRSSSENTRDSQRFEAHASERGNGPTTVLHIIGA